MTELETELLRVIARGAGAPVPECEFDRLALAVFRYQFERNAPYQAFCRARGATPDSVRGWREIPAVPTAAFKEADLTTVSPECVRVVYRTSGTTRGNERQGRQLLPDTRLYDAALLASFGYWVVPDVPQIRVLVLGPTARWFPHSSLGHMATRILERWGAPGSDAFWTEEGPRLDALAAALELAEQEGTPVCLLATAFGMVHLLDYLAERDRRFRLPPGSRIMDTGGYKGRSRVVPKETLYALYGERLGVPLTHVINEYGMTELSSQFYDTVLVDHLRAVGDPSVPARRKLPPPWVRTLVVDPETLEPLPPGREGLLRHVDLANLHTVLAIQTDDLGVQRDGGFEVLGRAAGAEPRGCSLMAEEWIVRNR